MRKKGAAVLLTACLFIGALLSVAPFLVYADDVFRGDVNTDDRVDTSDAVYLHQYNSGLITLSLSALMNADINDDGWVDSEDSLLLYAIASGDRRLDGALAPTNTLYGIDVSYAQGEVDWAAVKESGVDFAVLRCGYGQDDVEQDDERWTENAIACETYDIPYGAYLFCYARTVEEAKGEAAHVLRLLKGRNLSLPVFYDMEYSSWQGDLTNAQYAAIAKAFCNTIEQAGYDVGVYANLDWWETRLTDPCFDDWYRWVAQYNDECNYEGTYHLWQFSDDGTVDGIDGTVDENLAFFDFGVLSEALSEE